MFDELSQNNLINQILKMTVMLLLKNANIKSRCFKKKMLFFSNVGLIRNNGYLLVINMFSKKHYF